MELYELRIFNYPLTSYDISQDNIAIASGLLCVAARSAGKVHGNNLGSP